jgi:hypothetical protein
MRESVNVTFDVYWFGRPRRWFGSLAAVTVPVTVADLTESFENAVLAVSSLPALLSAFAAVAAFALLHAAVSRMAAMGRTERRTSLPRLYGRCVRTYCQQHGQHGVLLLEHDD